MSKFSKLVQKQKDKQEVRKTHFNLEAKTNANREGVVCACGSKKSYRSCCEPIHKEMSKALLPVDLMKSRYTAYTLGAIDYLMESHHTTTRPLSEKKEILAWSQNVKWLQLEIVAAPKPTDKEGFVTFKAFFLEDGKQQVIFEKSRFVKENNHWSYIDGEHL